jgi:acyl-CoA thioesterase-2
VPTQLDALVALLDLEPIEVNLFRGHSPVDRWQRVFGGQVIGQALMAATRTVDDRVCHSLHAYFLRPGDPKVPILYQVDRARDGRSFTSRRVVAIQHGKQIFNLAASLQIVETGLDHQVDMPDVAGPEGLSSDAEIRQAIAGDLPEKFRAFFSRSRSIELRPVEPLNLLHPPTAEPKQNIWFRVPGTLPDEVAIQQSVLAYMSDMTLLDTSTNPHAINFLNPKMQAASLDHAMWFHRPFRADQWLLYAQDSPSASGARGFSRGSIFDTAGRLVASVAQEGLIRVHE